MYPERSVLLRVDQSRFTSSLPVQKRGIVYFYFVHRSRSDTAVVWALYRQACGRQTKNYGCARTFDPRLLPSSVFAGAHFFSSGTALAKAGRKLARNHAVTGVFCGCAYTCPHRQRVKTHLFVFPSVELTGEYVTCFCGEADCLIIYMGKRCSYVYIRGTMDAHLGKFRGRRLSTHEASGNDLRRIKIGRIWPSQTAADPPILTTGAE